MFSADIIKGYKKKVFLYEAYSLNAAEQNIHFPVKNETVLRNWLKKKKSHTEKGKSTFFQVSMCAVKGRKFSAEKAVQNGLKQFIDEIYCLGLLLLHDPIVND